MRKRISSANVGIEHLSFYYAEDIKNDFPDRFSLSPNGDSIPCHLDQLFELCPGDNTLKALIEPKISDLQLLRPNFYRDLFNETAMELDELSKKLKSNEFKETSKAMKRITVDQSYLSLAFHLLLQV